MASVTLSFWCDMAIHRELSAVRLAFILLCPDERESITVSNYGTQKKIGTIRKNLVRSLLAVAFSTVSISPTNENEMEALINNVERLATYDWEISCSVPDDLTQAFLYSNDDPADLIVDHFESPFLGRIEMMHFKPQKREVDGFDIENTQIIGACYYLKDGEYRWADAFHVSAAGTREQLSYPDFAPIWEDQTPVIFDEGPAPSQ